MPIALLALAIGTFGFGCTEFMAMGLLPDVAEAFGVSIPVGGYMISAYAAGVVVGAPLLTALGARVDRKRLLLALMALYTLGNLVAALAPTFEVLIAARVLTALPHGTFFGIGSVVAASLVPVTKRAQAISMVIAGLTVANIIGVPLATLLGQQFGWRAAFWIVTALGLLTLAAVARLVPAQPPRAGASLRAELGALGRGQVWLTLLVGAIGFGGMFASYSYISPMMTDVAGFGERAVTLILAVYGVGMTLGNLVGGRMADRAVMPSIFASMTGIAVMLLVLHAVAEYRAAAVAAVFLLGFIASTLIPALQTRLMDAAKDAPSLAAALNHAALNFANAVGAWLGGLVIAAGYGYTAPNLLGAALAVVGVGLALASSLLDRRTPAAGRAGDVAAPPAPTASPRD
ncbi:MFS transporter [Marinitenerispora sediminis]|uniref:MFS transporter n=1 Tax=Marinitenerispora sediminis TaxID=1931232 RepID=A0A368TA31_9ACTN|nr:MFS transporter [Marinitenerispora sediminis]RCV52921.1 MFS transporter [Marinitenerispora sediminis]RCV60738.1 MFS transporter [Marinitenerispora sediminis]RCV61600.1 MFS transporter [Marinitenerispora sediminis]